MDPSTLTASGAATALLSLRRNPVFSSCTSGTVCGSTALAVDAAERARSSGAVEVFTSTTVVGKSAGLEGEIGFHGIRILQSYQACAARDPHHGIVSSMVNFFPSGSCPGHADAPMTR